MSNANCPAVPCRRVIVMVDVTQNAVEKFYDQHAKDHPRYAAILAEPNLFASDYRHTAESHQFDRIIDPQPSDVWLEYGSGGGRWMSHVARRVDRVIGVELSPQCAELARHRLRHFPNAEILVSDLRHYQPPAATSVIYYAGVLLYLDDDEIGSVLDRHLRDRAGVRRILVRDSLAQDQTHQLHHASGYTASYRTVERWTEIFKSVGFDLKRRLPANVAPLTGQEKLDLQFRLTHRLLHTVGRSDRWLRRIYQRRLNDRMTDGFIDRYRHDFLLFEPDR